MKGEKKERERKEFQHKLDLSNEEIEEVRMM